MKHEKISIKWKIFFYLLLFTACLLVLLWFFQIVYLDSFYKMITKNNARSVEQEAISILESDSEEKEALENVQVVIDEAKRLTKLFEFNLTDRIQKVLERYNKLKEQDGYRIDFEYQ